MAESCNANEHPVHFQVTKMEHEQDSEVFCYEEEVTSTKNTLAEIGRTQDILSNITSVSAIQNILRNFSPSSIPSQIIGFQPETQNRYCGTVPQFLVDHGFRYIDSNGQYQIREGRLPSAGPPPESDPEGIPSSASPSPPAARVEDEVQLASTQPKPSLKMVLKIPKQKLCFRFQIRPRIRAPSKAMKTPSRKLPAYRCIAARKGLSKAARDEALAARMVEEAAKLNERMQRKIRRKWRKLRREQFIRDLLAFQEEIIKTDAELTRVIADGKVRIAHIQERRRLREERREARRQLKRAKLAASVKQE